MDETAMGKQFDKSLTPYTVEYKYKTGAIYKGYMKGGFRDGKGIMIWPDKAKYDGEWKEGFASGNGKFYHADGGTYNG